MDIEPDGPSAFRVYVICRGKFRYIDQNIHMNTWVFTDKCPRFTAQATSGMTSLARNQAGRSICDKNKEVKRQVPSAGVKLALDLCSQVLRSTERG